jgi:bifunctional DNA-binding transcriptional regulator/antitoxin component of YhaV-PrlF toxin-antitoxin module
MNEPAIDVQAIIDSDLAISDKIRRLSAAGLGRSQIAKHVDRSYQQVRQVLVEDERRAQQRQLPSPPAAARPPVGERASNFAGIARLEVGAGGALQLPPELRSVLGAREGVVLIAEVGEDRVTILSARAAMAKIEALVSSLNIGGTDRGTARRERTRRTRCLTW